MWISTSKEYECPVCYTTQKLDDSVKCLRCKNIHICNSCILRMCEEGICERCPVCRQRDWRLKRCVEQTKIVPRSVLVINNNMENSCICVCNYRKNFKRCVCLIIGLICYLGMAWLGGFVTMLVIAGWNIPEEEDRTDLLLWLPLIVGIPCTVCMTYWCMGGKMCIMERVQNRVVHT